MTTLTSKRCPRQVIGAILTAMAVVLLATGTFTFLSAPAGAASECGDYSYGFAGTRLINDGISTSAGPFAIDLPAGTYTVTLVSNDHHDTQINAETQPGETYHVVLNSGYVSPASTDIPDDLNDMTTTFTNQKIEASTTISVKHSGVPGINSVNVLCIGFTPEAAIAPISETPVPEEPVKLPVVDTPIEVAPPTAIVDPPAEVTPPAAVVNPPVEATPPTDLLIPPVVEERPVEPEVKSKVELPPVEAQVDPPAITQLAITGPSTQAMALLGLGLLFILLGGLLIRGEKQFA